MANNEITIHISAKDDASKVFVEATKNAGGFRSALADTAKVAGGFVLGQGLMKAPGVLGDIATSSAQLDLAVKKSATVFGDQKGVVDEWAKANAAAMGLTKNEAVGAAAAFADLLIPMGFGRAEAAKMSTDVVGLAGALSEWSGGQKSAAQVSDILAKAMLGERDGLKALGISISEEDVKAQLLKDGTDKLTGAQLEQAKATATQELIFAKSADAQKAFADGAGSAARQQAEMSAKSKELKEQMDKALLPVLTKGLDLFGKLPGSMQQGVAVMGQFGPALAPMAAGLATVLPMLGAMGVALLTPPLGFVVALVAAGAAVYIFRDQILDGLGAAKDWITDHWMDIAAVLAGPFAIVATDAFGIRTALIDTLQKLPGAAFDLAKKIGEAIADGIKDGIKSIPGIIADAVKPSPSTLLGAIPGVGPALSLGGKILGRDTGGNVTGRQLYIVGEKGPELFIPNSSGTIVPADLTAQLRQAASSYAKSRGWSAAMEQGEIGAALEGLQGFLSGGQVAPEWMQAYGGLAGGRGGSANVTVNNDNRKIINVQTMRVETPSPQAFANGLDNDLFYGQNFRNLGT